MFVALYNSSNLHHHTANKIHHHNKPANLCDTIITTHPPKSISKNDVSAKPETLQTYKSSMSHTPLSSKIPPKNYAMVCSFALTAEDAPRKKPQNQNNKRKTCRREKSVPISGIVGSWPGTTPYPTLSVGTELKSSAPFQSSDVLFFVLERLIEECLKMSIF